MATPEERELAKLLNEEDPATKELAARRVAQAIVNADVEHEARLVLRHWPEEVLKLL